MVLSRMLSLPLYCFFYLHFSPFLFIIHFSDSTDPTIFFFVLVLLLFFFFFLLSQVTQLKISNNADVKRLLGKQMQLQEGISK